MSGILKLYYYMCLAVGFINLHYDPKTESLQLYHWATILYVGVVNIIALAYQPIHLILYFNTMYYCEDYDVSSLMGGLRTISNSLTLAATISEAWLKRKRFRSLCYAYRNLVRKYLSECKINENQEVVRKARNILIRKTLTSLCRMVMFYIQLYKRVVADEFCAYVYEPSFIGATIYMGLVNMMLILLDFTVILGFVLIDLCLNMLLNNLKRIEHDVDLMNRVYAEGYRENQKKIHRKWRIILSKDTEAITDEVKKFQQLAQEHTEIYQVPLMFMLLSVFLTLISAIFLVVNFWDDVELFNGYIFPFLALVLMATISNSMTLFNVCESLTQDLENMCNEVYELSIKVSLINRGSFYRDHLEISMEALTRQLRLPEFKVSICGLFDLHRSAGMAMMGEICLYLFCVIQFVVDFEVSYDDYYQYEEY